MLLDGRLVKGDFQMILWPAELHFRRKRHSWKLSFILDDEPWMCC